MVTSLNVNNYQRNPRIVTAKFHFYVFALANDADPRCHGKADFASRPIHVPYLGHHTMIVAAALWSRCRLTKFLIIVPYGRELQ